MFVVLGKSWILHKKGNDTKIHTQIWNICYWWTCKFEKYSIESLVVINHLWAFSFYSFVVFNYLIALVLLTKMWFYLKATKCWEIWFQELSNEDLLGSKQLLRRVMDAIHKQWGAARVSKEIVGHYNGRN